MMILFRETSWWYWAALDALLIAGLAGRSHAFHVAIALSIVQLIHFWLREGRFSAFPVQVRLTYAAILLLAGLGPRWLYWAPATGTFLLVVFGYCILARTLSLLPWNRREPFSWSLVWRTFSRPPVRGTILQGLPAAR